MYIKDHVKKYNNIFYILE